MNDSITMALRDLRGGLDTDAMDADTLRAALARHGLAIVPAEVTATIRRAVWRAQYEHVRATRWTDATPETIADLAEGRIACPAQIEQDRVAWRAGIAAAEQEVRGDG